MFGYSRWYVQGKEALADQKYEKAVEKFSKAAQGGDARAKYELGLCFQKGQGVNQSDVEAVKAPPHKVACNTEEKVV